MPALCERDSYWPTASWPVPLVMQFLYCVDRSATTLKPVTGFDQCIYASLWPNNDYMTSVWFHSSNKIKLQS